MSITGTLVGSSATTSSNKPSCPRCGQPRPKNQEVCDDCAFISEDLPTDVVAVMAAYEEGLSDSQIAAKVKRSVSFVRRTRARYGLLSARARAENPDGAPIDYLDPNTNMQRYNWITEYPRGWYYRFTFVGPVRGNTAAIRKILEKAYATDLEAVKLREGRGFENPQRPAVVLHPTALDLLDRARNESAVEICTDLTRAVNTADVLFLLFNGGRDDRALAHQVLAIRRKTPDVRIVLVNRNEVVAPEKCAEVLRAVMSDR